MARILVSGLNPAWQKVLEFSALHPGEVNRARTLLQLPSGKGINVAKVLRRLGHEVSLLQILGGVNGRRCLEGCEALGIRSLHAWVEAETRQCLTLMDGAGAATEIIEPFDAGGGDIGPRLLAALPAEAGAFDALVLSGTIPPGGPADMYDLLLERYRPRLALLDSTHPLRADSLARVTCLKVNRREYEALPPAARAAPLAMITDGGGEAAVARAGKPAARLSLPRLDRVRNPIGAGDTAAAGLAHHLLAGFDPTEAFRRGLAMASASCLRLDPAEYEESDYARLLAEVKVV